MNCADGAKVIIMAHLWASCSRQSLLSLAPVAARLKASLAYCNLSAHGTYGEDARAKVDSMEDGDVVLENVRFNPGRNKQR